MSEINEKAKEMEELLRLKIPLIGIKYFTKQTDIPPEFEIIKDNCSICQVIGKARFHEMSVATTKDAARACGLGGVVSGFFNAPPDIVDGSRNAGAWAKTTEATAKLVHNRMKIESGKFEAIGAAPLESISLQPDVVQVWGSPVQMLHLIYAQIWDGGDNIELSSNGHGASCYEALVVPYLTGKVKLAIADVGDRRFAYAGDDEMIMGFPVSQLERLVNNLRESYTGAYKFPYQYHMFPIWKGAVERCGA